MAARQRGEKRKQRWVGATDAEWTEICEGAQAAGLSNSDYVIRCCLDGKARAEPNDVGLLWRDDLGETRAAIRMRFLAAAAC